MTLYEAGHVISEGELIDIEARAAQLQRWVFGRIETRCDPDQFWGLDAEERLELRLQKIRVVLEPVMSDMERLLEIARSRNLEARCSSE